MFNNAFANRDITLFCKYETNEGYVPSEYEYRLPTYIKNVRLDNTEANNPSSLSIGDYILYIDYSKTSKAYRIIEGKKYNLKYIDSERYKFLDYDSQLYKYYTVTKEYFFASLILDNLDYQMKSGVVESDQYFKTIKSSKYGIQVISDNLEIGFIKTSGVIS